MQLARLISSQCKRGRWSTTDHLISSRSLGRSQCLCISYSSWTVFVTIYPMQFLSWLDSKALWQSIFSPRWFAPGKMVPNWSPDQHKCQTTWSHSVFLKVFLAIFQMYLSIPTKCISASDQLPDPSDSLARPIIHLIGWFPPGEQHLIVQSWQISADHVCLSSRLQIEFLSFCEISNTF